MIDILSVWKSTFEALPLVGDSSWITGTSTWVDDRVTAKAELTGIINPISPFTFSKPVFETGLSSMVITGSQATGVTAFATAWEAAIVASAMVITSGAFIGTPSPATTWSAVTSSVIDPASITLAKAKLLELISEPPAVSSSASVFADKLFEAFLLLTGTVTGSDSTPGPTGPLPLVAAAVPFI